MGLKTESSLVDAWLSKMEAAIKNITSLAVVGNLVVNQLMEREATTGNLAVNQLMEREAAVAITAKAAFMEEPKWTTVMAKNMCQVVNRVVETLANTPKQEERKFNMCLMSFEAKEGEIERELV
jgi:hypothetical protein